MNIKTLVKILVNFPFYVIRAETANKQLKFIRVAAEGYSTSKGDIARWSKNRTERSERVKSTRNKYFSYSSAEWKDKQCKVESSADKAAYKRVRDVICHSDAKHWASEGCVAGLD